MMKKQYEIVSIPNFLNLLNLTVESKIRCFELIYFILIRNYYYLKYFIGATMKFRYSFLLYLIELIINGFSISESKSDTLYNACMDDIKKNGMQCFAFFHIIPDINKTHETHLLICSKINSNKNYKDLATPEIMELNYILFLLSELHNGGQIVMNIGDDFADLDSFHCHFKSNSPIGVYEVEIEEADWLDDTIRYHGSETLMEDDDGEEELEEA